MPKKHILIVEDEEHLAVGIKFNLEAEGYRVTHVADGTSALHLAQQQGIAEIDLLILDLMLPGTSGYAVCESLREQGWDKPILMLSARTLAEDRKRGFDVGTNQYMTKPFDLDELISRVRNLLTLYRPRRDAQSVERYLFGNVRVDFATFEVFRQDAPVRMTQLEMKLLQYFVQHEGRVIPRHELLENVWSLPGHVQTRAPDQFIRRLRKAFEPDPANPVHFLTIRDAGYRFVAHPAGSDHDDHRPDTPQP